MTLGGAAPAACDQAAVDVVTAPPPPAAAPLSQPTGDAAPCGCAPWRPSPGDAVSVLTVYGVLLFLIPSNLVVGPLGAAGTPAGIMGLLLLIWWANARQVAGLGAARGFQPIRLMVFVFAGAVIASYAAAAVRPAFGAEIRGANRGILGVAGLLGVALVAADGIPSKPRLETLVRRIVALGGGHLLRGHRAVRHRVRPGAVREVARPVGEQPADPRSSPGRSAGSRGPPATPSSSAWC